MNTIRDRIPVEMLLRQFIDETQEVEVTKVEKLIETKPLEEPKPKPVEQKPVPMSNNMNNDDMPSFFRNETPRSVEPTNFNEPKSFQPPNFNEPSFQPKIPTFNEPSFQPPKVGFSGNDSVLTFESTNEMVSLGDILPSNSLDAEDLEKPSDSIKLEFEEL
jgi:hypothetical protein